MPYYDYQCETCGPFEQFRRMSEATQPMACPSCQQSARRVLSSPFLATMNPHSRIAHERNERSAHEPRVERRGGPATHDHTHGHGHSHGHGHHHPHHHGHAAKRPWMIGH